MYAVAAAGRTNLKEKKDNHAISNKEVIPAKDELQLVEK